MPEYIFKCPKCGNELKFTMKISEYARPSCMEPGCDGHQEMHQVPQASNFQLKGTGWTPKGADSWGAPTDIAMPKKR
jgi:putative FmdB family regulatory protein